MTFVSDALARPARRLAKAAAICLLGLAAIGAQAYVGPSGMQAKYEVLEYLRERDLYFD